MISAIRSILFWPGQIDWGQAGRAFLLIMGIGWRVWADS
jgi:hypothetical protein